MQKVGAVFFISTAQIILCSQAVVLDLICWEDEMFDFNKVKVIGVTTPVVDMCYD